MKNKNLVITALFIFLAAGLFAQKNNMNMSQNKKCNGMFMNIPDLTEAQQTQIKEIRTATMKEMLPLKNELKEKQAHLQTLQTADNPKMNEINSTIDEIGVIKTKMAKNRAAGHQKIRKILTDDQRIYFDMHAGQMHKKMMQKNHPKGGMMNNMNK